MRRLGGRDNRSIGNEREVDSWVWDQVGLELVQVDIEGAIESKRGSDRRNNYKQINQTLALRNSNPYLEQ